MRYESDVDAAFTEQIVDHDPPPSTANARVWVAHQVEQFEGAVIVAAGGWLDAAEEATEKAVERLTHRRPVVESPLARQMLEGASQLVEIQFQTSEELLARWHRFGRRIVRNARPLWTEKSDREWLDGGA